MMCTEGLPGKYNRRALREQGPHMVSGMVLDYSVLLASGTKPESTEDAATEETSEEF